MGMGHAGVLRATTMTNLKNWVASRDPLVWCVVLWRVLTKKPKNDVAFNLGEKQLKTIKTMMLLATYLRQSGKAISWEQSTADITAYAAMNPKKKKEMKFKKKKQKKDKKSKRKTEVEDD
jgi:hypothetical protein